MPTGTEWASFSKSKAQIGAPLGTAVIQGHPFKKCLEQGIRTNKEDERSESL